MTVEFFNFVKEVNVMVGFIVCFIIGFLVVVIFKNFKGIIWGLTKFIILLAILIGWIMITNPEMLEDDYQKTEQVK